MCTAPSRLLLFIWDFQKQSSHANFKRLWLEHLVPLVQLSFECGRFTAVGNAYRQIRGTCMGNQISPILSEIAVAAVEVAWSRALSSQFVGHRIFHRWRYVDNRVLLMSQSSKAHSAVQTFLHSDVYGPPVLNLNWWKITIFWVLTWCQGPGKSSISF